MSITVQATINGTTGVRVRKVRELLALTSQEMATAIHISRGFLSEIENDKSEVSDKVLRSMELELGVSPAFVRTGELPPLIGVKKFTELGKQVAQSVGSDAFGGADKLAKNDTADASNSGVAPVRINEARDSDALDLVKQFTETKRVIPVSPSTAVREGGADKEKVQQNVVEGGVPTSAAHALNADLLREILGLVVDGLRRKHLELPPEKLAELVVLIYEHTASDAGESDKVAHTTQRYLRLVA